MTDSHTNPDNTASSPEDALHRLMLDNGFRYVDSDEATYTGFLSELETAIQTWSDRRTTAVLVRLLTNFEDVVIDEAGNYEYQAVPTDIIYDELDSLSPKAEEELK